MATRESVFPIPLPPSPDRLSPSDTGTAGKSKVMKAVITQASGGYEKLKFTEVPIPRTGPNTSLIRVLAAGVNNTEINTRTGWYSSRVDKGTDDTEALWENNPDTTGLGDGSWAEPAPFPFIQGTDCCGVVEESSEHDLIGRRVLIRPCMRTHGFSSQNSVWMGSDFDGSFASYVLVPTSEVFPVNSSWSDTELGSIPCAYGTAENMLHRSGLQAGETVLIQGASGGVGSAAVQLALRRGARVIARTSASKFSRFSVIPEVELLNRDDDVLQTLGEKSVDLIVDNVGGNDFSKNAQLLRNGGRIVSSGAIAGALVDLDLRQLYLKDISFIGTTAWDEPVFPNLIGYIERNEIKALVSKTFTLQDIVQAQKALLERRHLGKIVLIPQS